MDDASDAGDTEAIYVTHARICNNYGKEQNNTVYCSTAKQTDFEEWSDLSYRIGSAYYVVVLKLKRVETQNI